MTHGPVRSGRSIRRGLGALALILGVVVAAAPAFAQGPPTTAASPVDAPAAATDAVDVIKVSGLIDPVLADFVERSVRDAEERGVVGLVMQFNSGGAVITEDRFERLASAIRDAQVPVYAWIGPSGAKAKGRSALLLQTVDRVGIAPGSKIGRLGDDALDDARFPAPWSADALARLARSTVGDKDAVALGVAVPAPIIGEFLIDLPGFRSRVDTSGEVPRRAPETQVRLGQLSILSNQFHTVGSPPVAYLLFLVGLGLLIFEFFTGGVGIAGVIGAGSFVLGAFGLDVLPARWWAVGLLVLAMFGFAIDVQVGVPRVWTGIGTVALVLGSIFLYEGMSLPWITLVAGIVGVLLGMVQGMPAMVRTRFSTPTIGREWMIGEMGVAETNIDPEGVVRVRDALWRARVNRATPIERGGSIRVAAIEGLTLAVEPEEGAARDYRERARGKKGEKTGENLAQGS